MEFLVGQEIARIDLFRALELNDCFGQLTVVAKLDAALHVHGRCQPFGPQVRGPKLQVRGLLVVSLLVSYVSGIVVAAVFSFFSVLVKGTRALSLKRDCTHKANQYSNNGKPGKYSHRAPWRAALKRKKRSGK